MGQSHCWCQGANVPNILNFSWVYSFEMSVRPSVRHADFSYFPLWDCLYIAHTTFWYDFQCFRWNFFLPPPSISLYQIFSNWDFRVKFWSPMMLPGYCWPIFSIFGMKFREFVFWYHLIFIFRLLGGGQKCYFFEISIRNDRNETSGFGLGVLEVSQV